MSRPANRTSPKSGASPSGSSSVVPVTDSAVPTLRVMRLQSPDLHQSFAGSLIPTHAIENSLCLPDSLGVFVGEKFTAYLGLLNASKHSVIRRLAVSALLQTPSQRWQLPSELDPTTGGGKDVGPNSGIDAIVSHDIEEAGQHILRVEVSYVSPEGNSKTFRKFYRFQVVSPLTITANVLRSGDVTCFVSVLVEFTSPDATAANEQQANVAIQKDQLLISHVALETQNGLVAKNIGAQAIETVLPAINNMLEEGATKELNALQLFDQLTMLSSGSSQRYLFEVQATTKDTILRGLAAGDVLGRAMVTWRKAMGEKGCIVSAPIVVPTIEIPELTCEISDGVATGTWEKSNFVMYNSGLSVDLAAASASINQRGLTSNENDLLRMLPVIVVPIDPPARMILQVAQTVQFLVVNHGQAAMNLQLQFQLPPTHGLAVSGKSYQTLGLVSPNGGSTVASARFLPLGAGFQRCQGCRIVDLATDRVIEQPTLFETFVALEKDLNMHTATLDTQRM
ncbi:hypothetical protein MPSEU_001028600 [Mayamaea pseudoterrestris]|nr:hypothetical protein MPSEU_001028600 [Mayamaea pseudoterrestris]